MFRHVLLVLIAGLFCAAEASAQVVTGTVVEASSSAPLRGAFIALLHPNGRQAAAVLSGPNGEFIIRATPGRYSLRVDMIGHQTIHIPAFDVAPEQTRTFPVRLEIAAMRLPELSVRGNRRCDARPESNAQTAAVWAEAKKALEVNAWVQGAGAATFNVRSYERWLDRNLDQVGAAEMKFSTTAGRKAFRASPPEQLALYGFVQSDENGGYLLYGPDAEVLLSNTFLDQHCFWLERNAARRGLIGLSFEPVRGRRIAEIEGTLWLDQATGELRYLEYGYVNVDHYDDRKYAGGRIEFERLKNGAWIVRRWYIRGPRLEQSEIGRIPMIVGAHEDGAEILNLWLPGEDPVSMVARVRIAGTVYDSIHQRPLKNAEVYLSGTQFKATADTAGAFSIDSVPAGLYYIAFTHPMMDSLPARPRPVAVDTAATARLRLATPAPSTVIAEACPASARIETERVSRDPDTKNRGVLFGRVDSTTDIAGARLQASWNRFVIMPNSSMRNVNYGVDKAPTNNEYIFCGVPLDRTIRLSVLLGDQVIARDSLMAMPDHGVARVDIRVRR